MVLTGSPRQIEKTGLRVRDKIYEKSRLKNGLRYEKTYLAGTTGNNVFSGYDMKKRIQRGRQEITDSAGTI